MNYEVIAGLLTGLFGLVSIASVIVSRKYSQQSNEVTKRLINEKQNKSKSNIEEIVNNTLINLPQSMAKTEYVSSLKEVLLEIGLDNMKYSNDTDNIDDLIKIHHEQALAQSKIQFWLSLIASIVGFIFIIIVILVTNGGPWYEYILKTLPGAVIEVVSVLFFKQSREIRERGTEFFDKLRDDKQINNSMMIISSIENNEIKDIMKARIASHIIGIENSEQLLSSHKIISTPNEIDQ